MNILGIEFDAYDKHWTIKSYLMEVLITLWCEGEDVTGNRAADAPGWTDPVYGALIRAGVVGGSFNDDGSLETVHWIVANDKLCNAIRNLGHRVPEEDERK